MSEEELSAIGRAVSTAQPDKGDYPERIARRAGVSLSTVIRARDLGLLSKRYMRSNLGQVYLSLSTQKQRILQRILRDRPKVRAGVAVLPFLGDDTFSPNMARDFWEVFHKRTPIPFLDIEAFLYWLYAEKGIKSNPDIFIKVLHQQPKPLVTLNVDGRGEVAFFTWVGEAKAGLTRDPYR